MSLFLYDNQNASLPRLFRLFRGLGLRHLVIVNDLNEVWDLSFVGLLQT